MAKRPVRRYEPKPKPKPAPGAAAKAREQQTERREAGRAAAPPAKPAAPKIPSYADRGRGVAAVPNPNFPIYAKPTAPKIPGYSPFRTSEGLAAYNARVPPFTAYSPFRTPEGHAAYDPNRPLIPGYSPFRTPEGLAAYNAANPPFAKPAWENVYPDYGGPRYGFSPSQFRSLENPPVRRGTMTKARAPVTARPYVQLEPPPEEQMGGDTGLGPEPYYPYPDYGGGGGDTGGGYGGYDGGGGGYPPSAPREVPPWYYGLVSWRF
jgi:hypothetical protein